LEAAGELRDCLIKEGWVCEEIAGINIYITNEIGINIQVILRRRTETRGAIDGGH
jgi:hypothetical protein